MSLDCESIGFQVLVIHILNSKNLGSKGSMNSNSAFECENVIKPYNLL